MAIQVLSKQVSADCLCWELEVFSGLANLPLTWDTPVLWLHAEVWLQPCIELQHVFGEVEDRLHKAENNIGLTVQDDQKS